MMTAAEGAMWYSSSIAIRDVLDGKIPLDSWSLDEATKSTVMLFAGKAMMSMFSKIGQSGLVNKL